MDVVTYALCKKLIDTTIASLDKVGFKKVDILPETGEPNYIYLVPKAKSLTANTLDEYIWINDSWEYVGNMELDLSEYTKLSDLEPYAKTSDLLNYVKAETLNTTLADYVKVTVLEQNYPTKVDLNTTLENYATNENLQSYTLKSELSTALQDYITKEVLKSTLANYPTNDTLILYAKKEELNKYATNESLKDYVKNSQLNSYATKSELSNYARYSDLEDYARKTDIPYWAMQPEKPKYSSAEVGALEAPVDEGINKQLLTYKDGKPIWADHDISLNMKQAMQNQIVTIQGSNAEGAPTAYKAVALANTVLVHSAEGEGF